MCLKCVFVAFVLINLIRVLSPWQPNQLLSNAYKYDAFESFRLQPLLILPNCTDLYFYII